MSVAVHHEEQGLHCNEGVVRCDEPIAYVSYQFSLRCDEPVAHAYLRFLLRRSEAT